MPSPLNGSSALTEGARLQRLISSCAPSFIPTQGNNNACVVRNSINFPITQSENSRIMLLTATTNGTLLNGGGVTQERAKQILAANQTFGSEGVRIALLQQTTIACATDPTDPEARFSDFNQPIVLPGCPPLPPPPAPPARTCVLGKNQKLGGM